MLAFSDRRGLLIQSQDYVKAKIRSLVFNIAAILISGFGILVAIKTYSKNAHHESFWVELGNPISIALIVFPFVVSWILMFFSKRADKEMETILKQHQADLKKGAVQRKS